MIKKICKVVLIIITITTLTSVLYAHFEEPYYCGAVAYCDNAGSPQWQAECSASDPAEHENYGCTCSVWSLGDFDYWYIGCEGEEGTPYVPYFNTNKCLKFWQSSCYWWHFPN